jgi:predicted RNA-binding protein associated with RNAse of E/G family
MKKVTIVKLDHQGHEVTRYPGEVLSHTDSKIVLETHFTGDDIDVGGLALCRGDGLNETYYFRRWYNIFEVYDGGTGQIKGWYCNVGYPAEMDGDVVSYRDLALDLVVFPDGKQIVLDEDEFEDLHIPQADKDEALTALGELQLKFEKKGAG